MSRADRKRPEKNSTNLKNDKTLRRQFRIFHIISAPSSSSSSSLWVPQAGTEDCWAQAKPISGTTFLGWKMPNICFLSTFLAPSRDDWTNGHCWTLLRGPLTTIIQLCTSLSVDFAKNKKRDFHFFELLFCLAPLSPCLVPSLFQPIKSSIKGYLGTSFKCTRPRDSCAPIPTCTW